MHSAVTLVADVVFVNGILLLITLSRKINLVTIKHAPTPTSSSLASLLLWVIQLYIHTGFRPHTVLMDMEFDKVKDKLPTIIINTTAARENVAEIKQKIWVVKE